MTDEEIASAAARLLNKRKKSYGPYAPLHFKCLFCHRVFTKSATRVHECSQMPVNLRKKKRK